MKSFESAALIIAAAVGLSACTITPPHVSVAAPSVVVWAPVAPPPPRVEVMPPPPSHEFFWVPGYWHWEANQHRWMDGHWERNREREHWVPHRWDPDERGQWRLNGGYWHRD
jgi:hypothetical protein